MSKANISNKKLGDILREKGWVTADQLAKALETQLKKGARLGQILIQSGHITEDQLAECLAQQMGIPHISMRFHQLDDHILDIIPQVMVERLRVIPLDHVGDILTIAISDGLSEGEIAEIEKHSGCRLKFYFTTISDFDYAYEVHYVRRAQEAGGSNPQEKVA